MSTFCDCSFFFFFNSPCTICSSSYLLVLYLSNDPCLSKGMGAGCNPLWYFHFFQPNPVAHLFSDMHPFWGGGMVCRIGRYSRQRWEDHWNSKVLILTLSKVYQDYVRIMWIRINISLLILSQMQWNVRVSTIFTLKLILRIIAYCA